MAKKAQEQTKMSADELRTLINKELGEGTLIKGSDPSLRVTHLPTGVFPVDLLLGGGFPRGRSTEIYGDFCVTPETRVLTQDLRWELAGDLGFEDRLIGFDEQVNQGRGRNACLRPSEIQRRSMKKLECVRIVTDRGEVTASVGHGFVARHRSQGSREWRRAGDIEVGDSLVWLCRPWSTIHTYDAGHAAGLLDGEGWLDKTRVSFGQVPGRVLDEGIATLKRLGFETSVNEQSNGVMRVAVMGGRFETLRALGQLRPVRLLDKAQSAWDGGCLVSKGPFTEPGSAVATVQAVERVGLRDVVAMQTSTKTFIANGFPSHNSTLKSYIALCCIAEVQAMGGVALLVDTEHAYDPEWAESIGVCTKDLLVEHPSTGEEAVGVSQLLLRQGIDLMVWDSVAATMTKQYAEKAPGEDTQVASLARFMSKSMNRLNTANKNTAMIFVNQVRTDVGITYGAASRVTTPGGKALGFYSSQRLHFIKGGRVMEDVQVHDGEKFRPGKEVVSTKIKAVLEKSKVNKPHREVWFSFDMRSSQIDDPLFLVSQGLEKGIITQKGAMWTIPEYLEDSVRGRVNFRNWLAEDEDAQQWLRDRITQLEYDHVTSEDDEDDEHDDEDD